MAGLGVLRSRAGSSTHILETPNSPRVEGYRPGVTEGRAALRAAQRRYQVVLDAWVEHPENGSLRDQLAEASGQVYRAQRTVELTEAQDEQTCLLADLARVGAHVSTVWDLHLHPDGIPAAVPVLLDHLERNYPAGVLQGITAALANRAARPWWPRMSDLYRGDKREVCQDGLAAAMAQIAVRTHYERMVVLLSDVSLGPSRLFFVRPVHRIGNRIRRGSGREAVEKLARDPELAREVQAVLRGRSRST